MVQTVAVSLPTAISVVKLSYLQEQRVLTNTGILPRRDVHDGEPNVYP
jgi:hypothetical protein